MHQVKSPTRRKILFVLHEATLTGAPIIALELMQWLHRNHAVDLLIITPTGGSIENELKPLGEYIAISQELYFSGERFIKDQFKFITNLARKHRIKIIKEKIRDWKPELVYFNSLVAWEQQSYFDEIDCPVITHIHEMSFVIGSEERQKLLNIAISRSCKLILCSESVRTSLASRADISSSIAPVVHSFLPERIQKNITNNPDKFDISSIIDIPKDAFVVGCVGTVCWRKGSDLFIQVAKIIGKQLHGRPIIYLWIGHGHQEELRRIRHDIALSEMADSVFFIGGKTDVSHFYQCFDLFLLTSREDPFPLVMLEAAYCSIPLIGFSGSGGIEEFGADGAAVLVPYLDINAMAEEALTLLSEPDRRVAMGQSAREYVINNFNSEISCNLIYDVIEETLTYK